MGRKTALGFIFSFDPILHATFASNFDASKLNMPLGDDLPTAHAVDRLFIPTIICGKHLV